VESYPVTQILDAARHGDCAAAEELWGVVYQDLRNLAGSRLHGLPPGQTLQPTALVNEAFLRLIGADGSNQVKWESRQHFFGAAARAMRNILVDEYRRRSRKKRGGGERPIRLVEFEVEGDHDTSEFDLLTLDAALKKLEVVAPRASEVVVLRFFGGLTIAEAAESMQVSAATVEREWTYARAWLFRELGGADGAPA
jgi:RNA polymerase sigma factor (TIGR02999 family)